MKRTVKKEIAKRINTKDFEGNQNGFLIEMFKDDDKTVVYLIAAKPGAFKGYHMHRIRAARWICIKGKIKVILYKNSKREEHILTSDPPKRLFIPPNVATGFLNIGDEDAWIVNYPDPPYDPKVKDEQIAYTEEELEARIIK